MASKSSKGILERMTASLLSPADPSNLAVLRIAFGMLMIVDIPQERGMSHIEYKFDPDICHFPLIHGLKPLPPDWMHVVYLVMFLGAWGIMLGCFYRLSCLAFGCTYWYIFILGKATWNNHSYLYGLFSIMLLLCDGDRCWSIDGLMNPKIRNAHVPLVNYFLLRFQIFLVYFFAGIKKMDVDWLTGNSMTGLSSKWVFAPFRMFLSDETINLVLVHYCGFAFDLFEGFLLVIPQTRPLGVLLGLMFHFMNSQMFEIGMFPYTMMATMLLFFSFDWPKKLLSYMPRQAAALLPSVEEAQPSAHCIYPDDKKPSKSSNKRSHPTPGHIIRLFIFSLYVAVQLFLPYSHFLTQGYNAWTQGLYGYSWDMMVHAWSTQHLRIKVVDKSNGNETFLRPGAFLGRSRRVARWSSHPDMIKQYVACLTEKIKDHPELQIGEPAVYLDIWRSMNRRFQQRFVDPTVDMATAPWSPLAASPWVQPLLTELTPWREKFAEINKDLREKSNFSDVVFVADFPRLHLENFVAEGMNTSLTLLHGKVEVEFDNVNHTLDGGGTITVPENDTHKVHVVSDTPACYMYVYVNMTMWNNETIRNWILHPETRPVSPERAMRKNMTWLDVFKRFAMEKYLTFRFSFTNTFHAIRNIILGTPEEPTEDPDEEQDDNSGGSDVTSGEPDGSGSDTQDASTSEGDNADQGDNPDQGGNSDQGDQKRTEL